MLELINTEREKAGVDPVVLGDNVAAQLHAEMSLENCISSHWGVDGLKPYMRYSLAGGYQSNGENGLGFKSCVDVNVYTIKGEIYRGMPVWMGSYEHRRNILGKFHKKVNIGLAWNNHRYIFVQHFEGDYVEYEHLPAIEHNIISFAGKTKNGVVYDKETAFQIYYDHPPVIPTKDQLAKTYCYDNGRLIGVIRPPIESAQQSGINIFFPSIAHCREPRDFDENVAPRITPFSNEVSAYSPRWITALEWTATGNEFSVRADLGELLSKYGNGVYSLIIWGKMDRERIVMSQYSIFHGITPPDTYALTEAQGEE